MPLSGLDHVTVRCTQAMLAPTAAFWRDVLGLQEGWRPPFNFPGAWLYLDARPVLHLVATVVPDEGRARAPLDHLAFAAHGLDATRARLAEAGIAFKEQDLPGTSMRQIFVHDPAGTRIELVFDLKAEQPA